ncbi:hypothetical protein [Lichenibacterium dinghuense]|uniref:hypothetical protein n=1 Tax=Lichenibacterium dinghuense TaxID=2895977 RepID=UPI001F258C94|nr:hypothetical protein [Lichenibacterium sp. 6Y81]
MLGLLRRLTRPAPPVPAPEPTGRMVTTPEYRAAVRKRAILAMQERAAILDEVGQVARVRARIVAMKTATTEAETIRSSRFTKEGAK